MSWKNKFGILLILSIPAFSGFPLKAWDTAVVSGLTWSWIIYFLSVHIVINLLLGLHRYGQIIGIATLITLPVIYSGACLSYLLWWINDGSQVTAYVFGAHYISLTITMLTVIPLSISLIAVFPFGTVEQKLLQRSDGVTKLERRFLMAVRVFSHIIFDVLPNILEVLKEERVRWNETDEFYDILQINKSKMSMKEIQHRIKGTLSQMIQIGVEGICTSMQYIPLWAVELSQLPQRRGKNKNKSLL